MKKEIDKINDKLEDKIHRPSYDKGHPQQQVSELKKQSRAIAAPCEEIEQYRRRLCLRIAGVPLAHGEASTNMFQKVKEICAESNLDIPDSNVGRAHGIGKVYFARIKKVNCLSII